MKIVVFSAQKYDIDFFNKSNEHFNHELVFHDAHLTQSTAILASGAPAVCVFVNDQLDASVLKTLANNGTKLVLLRCTGFNNVDRQAAKDNGLVVARVPAYSPYAVAEYTVGLCLALDRKIHKASMRVRENNFDLNGLLGQDLHGRTIGVLGTGAIGALVARAFKLGFGCNVLAHDLYPKQELKDIGVQYVERDEMFRRSSVLLLHCPLNKETRHIINSDTLKLMPNNVAIVNTGRGKLIDTHALVDALESRKVGGAALDVYEEETGLFYIDRSEEIVRDDLFERLLTFTNVLVTGHQAFFTQQALTAISETTLTTAKQFEDGRIDQSVLVV